MQLAIQEPYMLTIQPDDFFISPRRLDENFGTMICFHRRYDLGDEHNYGDNEDFLKDLYLKTVGNDEKGEEKYDRLLDRLSKQPDTPFGSREYACAVNQALMAEIEKEHIVLPLYLYDHSVLAMSTDSFIGRAVMRNGTAVRSDGSMYPKRIYGRNIRLTASPLLSGSRRKTG